MILVRTAHVNILLAIRNGSNICWYFQRKGFADLWKMLLCNPIRQLDPNCVQKLSHWLSMNAQKTCWALIASICSEVTVSYVAEFCGAPTWEAFRSIVASGISDFYRWGVENNRKTVDSFFRPSPNIANKGFVKFPQSAAFKFFFPHLGDLFQQNSSPVTSCKSTYTMRQVDSHALKHRPSMLPNTQTSTSVEICIRW